MARNTQTIWDTGLGKALQKVIPPETMRVIIDIGFDDFVKVYYQCNATEELLDLDWTKFLTGGDVISGGEQVKGKTWNPCL
jgi:hypothetical protein